MCSIGNQGISIQNNSINLPQKTSSAAKNNAAEINTTDSFNPSPKVYKDRMDEFFKNLTPADKSALDDMRKNFKPGDVSYIDGLRMNNITFESPGELKRQLEHHHKSEKQENIKEGLLGAIAMPFILGLGVAEGIKSGIEFITQNHKTEFIEKFGTDAYYNHSRQEREEMLANHGK